MVDFCSRCEPEFHDVDLMEIALELGLGYTEQFTCEDCGCLGLYKDEKGLLNLVFREVGSRDVKFEKMFIEEL